MADVTGDASLYDPELGSWFERVVDLAGTEALGAPDFLASAERLEQDFAELARFRSPAALERGLLGFARRRLRLVDEGEEYAEVGNELVVLAGLLGEHAALVAPALKQAVIQLSAVLSEPGVVSVFGKLLKRLKLLARTANDAELARWVREVVAILPGEAPAEPEA